MSIIVSMAAPLSVQCSGGYSLMSIGTATLKMKFVDWPVVERTPALAEVLYTGQRYLPEPSSSSSPTTLVSAGLWARVLLRVASPDL